MNESQKELLDDIQKTLKIWKIKAKRAWHRFDKQAGVSRFAKKMTLALGLKLIILAAPNAQISLHAQNVTKSKEQTSKLLAHAAAAKSLPEYTDFIENNHTAIIERQKEFALALWENMQENVETVQGAEKKGTKSKTLHNLFGQYKKYNLSIDPAYFCASSGLGTLIQTFEEKNFKEYEAIVECLTNPNHCGAIIRDLDASFGQGIKTRDARQALAEIYAQNPYAVCLVFKPSSRSRSGYHYSTTFSNAVAVDTLITKEDSIKGKVATFNRTMITDTEKYFPVIPATMKKEYRIYDISNAILDLQLFQMYMEYIEKANKFPKFRPTDKEPSASLNKPKRKNGNVIALASPVATRAKRTNTALPQRKNIPANNNKEDYQPTWAAVSNTQQKNIVMMKKSGRHFS